MNNYLVFHFNKDTEYLETYPVSAFDKESAVLAVGEHINSEREEKEKPLLSEDDLLFSIESNDFSKISDNFEAFIEANS